MLADRRHNARTDTLSVDNAQLRDRSQAQSSQSLPLSADDLGKWSSPVSISTGPPLGATRTHAARRTSPPQPEGFAHDSQRATPWKTPNPRFPNNPEGVAHGSQRATPLDPPNHHPFNRSLRQHIASCEMAEAPKKKKQKIRGFQKTCLIFAPSSALRM